jgi:putative two-component system response regulator
MQHVGTPKDEVLGLATAPQREEPIRVLILDDDRALLDSLHEYLETRGFEVDAFARTADALKALEKTTYDAVVTDVLLDGRTEGQEVLKSARARRPDVVVVMMTAFPILEDAVGAMRHGAADYLRKPVNPRKLSAFLHREIQMQRFETESFALDDLVAILSELVARTIEHIDPYTRGHGERAAYYCDKIARRFEFNEVELQRLRLAAIAHDYGKIYLRDLSFLTKEGPLTELERQEIMRHPHLGAEKLSVDPRLKPITRAIAEHHERFDGRGYPYGLKGDEISLPGRILCVVEVLDALATRRSYKPPWPIDKIRAFFHEQRGNAFDPAVSDRVLSAIEEEGAAFFAPDPDGGPGPM